MYRTHKVSDLTIVRNDYTCISKTLWCGHDNNLLLLMSYVYSIEYMSNTTDLVEEKFLVVQKPTVLLSSITLLQCIAKADFYRVG